MASRWNAPWGAHTATFRLLVRNFGFIGIDGYLPADLPADASTTVMRALKNGWLQRHGAGTFRLTDRGRAIAAGGRKTPAPIEPAGRSRRDG